MDNILHFSDKELCLVEQTIDMAEDMVAGYFNMSSDEWMGYRYEVKTLAELNHKEKTDKAFAQICKYECVKKKDLNSPQSFDLYRICLQDNWILHAVNQPLRKISLGPLILYIAVHELSHVVRFSKYYKDFFASPLEKELEEAKVHSITREMLKSLKDTTLNHVLGLYRRYCWEA